VYSPINFYFFRFEILYFENETLNSNDERKTKYKGMVNVAKEYTGLVLVM